MFINFFIWWIRFYLNLAYKIVYYLFGVELGFLKTVSEKIGKFALYSSAIVLIFIVLTVTFTSGFLVAGTIVKSFILPTGSTYFAPNIYEEGKYMKGNILLADEDYVKSMACKRTNKGIEYEPKIRIQDKDQARVQEQMCSIINSGNFVKQDFGNYKYEFDVDMSIVDQSKAFKNKNKNLTFDLSWLKFGVNSSRTKARNYVEKRFSSVFKAEQVGILSRIWRYFSLNGPQDIKHNLITKYFLEKQYTREGLFVYALNIKYKPLASIELIFTIKYDGIQAFINYWWWQLNLTISIWCGSGSSIFLILLYLVLGGDFGANFLSKNLGLSKSKFAEDEYNNIDYSTSSNTKSRRPDMQKKKRYIEDDRTRSDFLTPRVSGYDQRDPRTSGKVSGYDQRDPKTSSYDQRDLKQSSYDQRDPKQSSYDQRDMRERQKRSLSPSTQE